MPKKTPSKQGRQSKPVARKNGNGDAPSMAEIRQAIMQLVSQNIALSQRMDEQGKRIDATNARLDQKYDAIVNQMVLDRQEAQKQHIELSSQYIKISEQYADIQEKLSNLPTEIQEKIGFDKIK